MKHKIIKLSCGSNINVFHNIFTDYEISMFHGFAHSSKYLFGSTSDLSSSLNKSGSFYQCAFTDEDDENFSLNKNKKVKEITNNYHRRRSWINSTLSGCKYYSHTDGNCITLLYYINPIWDTDHGGETFFYNSYGEKEIAIDFIPGQVVVFDGRLKHKPGLVYGNPEPRYIYTCQYWLATS